MGWPGNFIPGYPITKGVLNNDEVDNQKIIYFKYQETNLNKQKQNMNFKN